MTINQENSTSAGTCIKGLWTGLYAHVLGWLAEERSPAGSAGSLLSGGSSGSGRREWRKKRQDREGFRVNIERHMARKCRSKGRLTVNPAGES